MSAKCGFKPLIMIHFSGRTGSYPTFHPHIKIRVTVGVSQSDLDLVRGGGAAGRRGLCPRAAV